MGIPDSPDYQQLGAGAQQLFGPFAFNDLSQAITLPANCFSLMVIAPSASGTQFPSCTGNTTGADYPMFQIPNRTLTGGDATWIAMILPELDQSVQITWTGGNLPGHWWVVADYGPRMIYDLATAQLSQLVGNAGFGLRTVPYVYQGGNLHEVVGTSGGVPYGVPSAPATDTGDRPPTELTYFFNEVTSTGTIIAAPGAGKRLRVFFAKVSAVVFGSTTTFVLLRMHANSVHTQTCLVGTGSANVPSTPQSQATYPLTGLALDANTAIDIDNGGSTFDVLVEILYTIETI